MKRSPLRRGQPLRQRGATSLRLEQWHDWCREQVMRRATVRGELRCEGCGEPARLDFAHLFRRGNIIAEPWCSLPEMAAALCRTCHRRIDEARDPRLLVALRFRALQRLRERFPRANLAIDLVGPDDDLVLAARIAERVLRERVEEQELPSFAPRWR